MATRSSGASQSALRWKTSIEFNIGPHRYVARKARKIVTTLALTTGPVLATVLDLGEQKDLDAAQLRERVDHIRAIDDVFRDEFLGAVLFLCGSVSTAEEGPSAELELLFAEWKTLRKDFISRSSIIGESDSAPELHGPVVIANGYLHKVWRIFDDTNRAFVTATWPSDTAESAYESPRLAGSDIGTIGVPVPSRASSLHTVRKPLDGIRVAVKDCFDLRGLRTSLANKAYFDLYPAKDKTARCVEVLIELGAIIVGKTHLSSFAWREEATQCIDFSAPFNPRADGYISPAASSSGSGVAISSYDWLDVTIGTDTTGSGRRPALWNGSFALRPSHGLLSSEGMAPTCATFDVPSLFTRDLARLKHVVENWYGNDMIPTFHPEKPYRIILPTEFLPVHNGSQMLYIDAFVEALCAWLRVPPEKISFAEEWEKAPPKECQGPEGLQSYLQHVTVHGFFSDFYHCYDNFRDDYRKTYGREAYISDPVRWIWGLGKLVSQEQRNEAFTRIRVFRDWFNYTIMKVSTHNAIVILPIETLEVRYREASSGWIPFTPPDNLDVKFVSPALGAPELVVPIGELPYQSLVSGRQEFLPVAIAMMGPARSDLQLIQMMEDFLEHNPSWHSDVKTGPRMWS